MYIVQPHTLIQCDLFVYYWHITQNVINSRQLIFTRCSREHACDLHARLTKVKIQLNYMLKINE